MYPVSPGWRWRPISRTRRGVAHLCTFPPSGEVLLPNCPPPGGGLDIRWWKSCLFECALPGGTVRRPFYRGVPTGGVRRGHLPGRGSWQERSAVAIYRGEGLRGPPWHDGRGPPWPDGRGPPWHDGRGPPWHDGRGPPWILTGGTMRQPCHQSTGQDRTQLLSACLPPGASHGHPRRAA